MAVIDAYYTYRHNTFRVWTSTTLGTVWHEAPYLRVEDLSEVAAPDIDTCVLSYLTGEFALREPDDFGNAQIVAKTWFNALDLNRHFVKVEMRDMNEEEAGEPVILRTWYGVIELDERDEAQKPDESVNRTGRQTLQAFGLLRLLETTIITQSVVLIDAVADETITIGRGLPFNFESRGALGRRGNRTAVPDGDGSHNFSRLPAGDETTGGTDNFWTASDAVQHLLTHHRPKDPYDDDLCEWVCEPLVDGDLPITFYDITVPTDRRSVKAVLDDLIDRRRGVGYRVYGRETDTRFEAVLEVFTFNATAIALEGGEEIPANENTDSLIAGSSTIVDSVKVRKIATHQVDELIVEGAPPTSTLTLRFGDNPAAVEELVKGWTDAQETAYKSGAGGTAEENAAVRCRDALKDVFARYLVASDWPTTVAVDATPDPEEFWVALAQSVTIPDDIEDADVHDLFLKTDDATRAGPLAFHVKRFLELMPLKDAETNEFRQPFVALSEGSDAGGQWAFHNVVSALHEDRRFNCTLRMLQDRLGFTLDVNRAGGQQLIAVNDWTGAAETSEDVDPAQAQGLDFHNLRITATIEWDARVTLNKTLNTPTGQKRTLYIQIPDMRLDFALPGTVIDIDDDGTLETTDGKVLKDDRARGRAILEAAAAWYSEVRQAITISYRELHPKLEIGTLITQLWGVSDDPINTPVTGIRHSPRQGMTTIETAYAEIDFSSFGRGAAGRYA